MLKISSHNCIAAPLRDGTSCCLLAAPSGLRFAQIRLASGFYCRRDRILLAHRNFLAALDQLIGALAQFAGLLLGVIFALIRLLGQKIARLFPRLRGKQNTDKRSYSQPYQEIGHLGSHIVRHSNLHRNRSIAVGSAQHSLTAMSAANRLLRSRATKLTKYFLRTL